MNTSSLNYWIFKLSDRNYYPEQPGRTYVYDNRHSVKVTPNDCFVYLDKRSGRYGFTGHGVVKKVHKRLADTAELRLPSVSYIYTAELGDFVRYESTLDIKPSSRDGRVNRSILGITDVNKLGWSRSIANLSQLVFEKILGLAYQKRHIDTNSLNETDYEVPDSWSFVRRRHSLERFRETVLHRQDYTCAICGTTVQQVLEVAHISSYSTDVKNRANPSNGIGLCTFCHRAFDRGVFFLQEDGNVTMLNSAESDLVAKAHVSNITASHRRKLITGVDKKLLQKRSESTLLLKNQ